MKKYIDKISSLIPFTQDRVDILLNGNDLIITGGNGSGKTTLVNIIFKKLEVIVRLKRLGELENWKKRKDIFTSRLENCEEGTADYQQNRRNIQALEEQIASVTGDPEIEINELLDFSKQVDRHMGVIEFFPAQRQSSIQDARSASGTNYDKVNLDNQNVKPNIGDQLEQHLVNLFTRRSFAITEKKNPDLVREITDWLGVFDGNLMYLMENDSTHLEFDADNFKFYILQAGRDPFTFQNLPSGYSAIFSVFSTLLMRAEYLKVSPSKLCGVVIIDELDAHLHVSLQRKILPFLSDSFPNIQYIVTTHSPFVVTSVNDAVIYDISRKEQVSDLSNYSYESVLEGLFEVHTSSDILQNKIREIATMIEAREPNIFKLKNLVMEFDKNLQSVDEESLFFINRAKLLINKSKLKK